MALLASACVGPIVLMVVLGWGGWLSFLLSGANPFAYVPETRERLAESLARGDAICAALEQAKASSGGYPPTLQALVPAHIAQIEPPILGDQRWRYERRANGGYSLELWIGPDYESESRSDQVRVWRSNR